MDATNDVPIACTLTPEAARNQALEWVDLQRHCTSVETIAAGARMILPASFVEAVQDLARRESSCCAFLEITTVVLDDSLILEVTSANPDAEPVIAALAGLAQL